MTDAQAAMIVVARLDYQPGSRLLPCSSSGEGGIAVVALMPLSTLSAERARRADAAGSAGRPSVAAR